MRGGRLLMIAHHFPPAGGSGANRALAFAEYLPRYGWHPIVLTPGAGWAANRDDESAARVPGDVRVVRTRSFEPQPSRVRGQTTTSSHRQRQFAPPSALRTHVGHLKRFPDAHVGWVPFAVAAGRRERFDLAYSSSGPFSSHLVGLLLKRLSGRPWVAELRDGWYRWNRAVFPDYPAWRDGLERRLEAVALRTADRVVLVTERMARAFRCQYPDLPERHFVVVPNGFDPRLRAEAALLPPRDPARFEVVHVGALYYGRSIAAVLEAIGRLVRTEPGFDDALRLTLVGTLDATAQRELAHGALANHVRVTGQVSHAAAVEAMRAADVLLLVANTTPGAEATVPGKLFEYLAVGRPILAIAPRASSTTDVLARTGGGWTAPADDPTAIADALRAAYHAQRAGQAPLAIGAEVDRFDRAMLTGHLARIFDEVGLGAHARRA